MSEEAVDLNDFISKKSKDRVYPLLRKFDAIWTNRNNMTFCQLVKEVTENQELSDKELSEYMNKYIEEHKLKWNG
jgi:transcription termination factor NusB